MILLIPQICLESPLRTLPGRASPVSAPWLLVWVSLPHKCLLMSLALGLLSFLCVPHNPRSVSGLVSRFNKHHCSVLHGCFGQCCPFLWGLATGVQKENKVPGEKNQLTMSPRLSRGPTCLAAEARLTHGSLSLSRQAGGSLCSLRKHLLSDQTIVACDLICGFAHL